MYSANALIFLVRRATLSSTSAAGSGALDIESSFCSSSICLTSSSYSSCVLTASSPPNFFFPQHPCNLQNKSFASKLSVLISLEKFNTCTKFQITRRKSLFCFFNLDKSVASAVNVKFSRSCSYNVSKSIPEGVSSETLRLANLDLSSFNQSSLLNLLPLRAVTKSLNTCRART